MHRLQTFLLVIALFAAAVQTEAADMKKMSALVRRAAMVAEGAVAAARQTGQVSTTSRYGVITAFVDIDTGLGDDVLSTLGCKVYARKGRIAIAEIPLDRLSELSEHPAVRRIEAGRRASLCMDTTTAVVNALPAYTVTPTHQAYTGSGVVVGVMDVGFDLTHPTFYDATGTRYRIGAFWDQLSKDTIDSRLPVGRDYVGYDQVLAQKHSVDALTQMHGTHTLGTAAGSGYDTRYRGMAYDSDICLVNNAVSSDIEYIDSADYYKFTTATDALGFKYMFDYADSLGKPCVTSFSEGYSPYWDEEDSLYAAFLDSLSTPGHIIVSSAGNESLCQTYMEKSRGQAAAGAFVHVNKEVAWYRVKADGPIRLSMLIYGNGGESPSDTLAYDSADPRLDEDAIIDTLLIGGDTLAVAVYRYASRFDATQVYGMEMKASRKISELPDMALVLEGVDTFAEAFGTSNYAFIGRGTDTRWSAAQFGHNIFAPSCFPAVISVGATTHRLCYQNHHGNWVNNFAGVEPGTRSYFSSQGPAANGALKPQVMAPGVNVVSALSSLADSAAEDKSIVAYSVFQDKRYGWTVSSGTSMAGPVVAGAIALWLQAKPDLTRDEVIDIIARTSRQRVAGIDYPNNDYGYGEIDVYAGLLDILGLTKIEGISTSSPQSLRVVPAEGQVHLLFGKIPQHPVVVRVYSLSGTLLQQCRLTATSAEAVVAMPQGAQGVYVVQTESADRSLTGSQLVRL